MASTGIFITGKSKKPNSKWTETRRKATEICEKEVSFLINPIYEIIATRERWKDKFYDFP